MRSFIVASAILIIIILVIIFSSLYVNGRVKDLISLCDELYNESSATKIDRLISEWQSCKDIISFSVHKGDVERADNAISAIQSYRNHPDDFRYYLTVFRAALNTIARSNRISADVVF